MEEFVGAACSYGTSEATRREPVAELQRYLEEWLGGAKTKGFWSWRVCGCVGENVGRVCYVAFSFGEVKSKGVTFCAEGEEATACNVASPPVGKREFGRNCRCYREIGACPSK